MFTKAGNAPFAKVPRERCGSRGAGFTGDLVRPLVLPIAFLSNSLAGDEDELPQ